MDADTTGRIRPGPPRLEGFDYQSSDAVYFVTMCAFSGTPFTDPSIASAVIDALTWLRSHRGISLYAYCLMPDHLHLLLQLPDGERDCHGNVVGASVLRRSQPQSLGSIIATMKGFTTRESWILGHEGKLWQENFYDHILRRSESGTRVAEYILMNPVRARLVMQPGDYPWSGMPDPM